MTAAEERRNVQRTRGRLDQVVDELAQIVDQLRELAEQERQGRTEGEGDRR